MTQIEARPDIPNELGPPAKGVSARGRLGVILISHAAVDVFSAFVPPIVGVLQVRASLSDAEAAWLIGIGSLFSGLSQPLSAWLSDRFDSRRFGMIGLAVAAICLSAIGIAESFWTLAALYAVGMVGVGVFHPVGASTMGQAAEAARPGSRSMAITFFFIAGMIGGILGAILSPRITALGSGFLFLALFMIPGVILAFVLHASIRAVPHRHHAHRDVQFEPHDSRARWFAVVILYCANAMRFTVNMALVYLAIRYAESIVAQANPHMQREAVASAAAPLAGNIQAMMIVGMAVGGLATGLLVRAGREKRPLVLIPILAAPLIVLMPRFSIVVAHVTAIAAGVGYASLVPVTLGLAQRLLPHRTMLASGLMLGGAWAVAILGPRLAEWCLDEPRGLGLSLETVFGLAAALLAISGMVGLALKRETIVRASLATSAKPGT